MQIAGARGPVCKGSLDLEGGQLGLLDNEVDECLRTKSFWQGADNCEQLSKASVYKLSGKAS